MTTLCGWFFDLFYFTFIVIFSMPSLTLSHSLIDFPSDRNFTGKFWLIISLERSFLAVARDVRCDA